MEFRIGELAKRTGCEIVTIRYYEKEGLLPTPPRNGGNFRLYCAAYIERLQFIRHCRSLDIALSEIRTLLGLRDSTSPDCGDVNALLNAHILRVEVRVEAMLRLKEHLLALREKCSGTRPLDSCGILQGLSDCSCHAIATSN